MSSVHQVTEVVGAFQANAIVEPVQPPQVDGNADLTCISKNHVAVWVRLQSDLFWEAKEYSFDKHESRLGRASYHTPCLLD